MKGTLIQQHERKEKSRYRYGSLDKIPAANGFVCGYCRGFVSTETGSSGVQNRNHCPYCLWSRHLDLYAAGDRLSACKAPMQPIGLTIKPSGKKYGRSQGELMLIHLCDECKALSINRIAADDDPYRIFAVFEESSRLDTSTLARLESGDIKILNIVDRDTVHVQLFGPGSVLAGIHSRKMALESV